MYSEKVLIIAEMCHEINAAYCEAIGDSTQVSWEDAPEWQKSSACMGVKLHLDSPEAGASASHESWMKQKIDDGWVFGEVKDSDKKTHPCIIDFCELPTEQKAKDYIFRAVVNSAQKSRAFD